MDVSLVDGLPIAGITAGGIVSAFVYAVLRGRLVPRSTLEDVRKDRDARLAEVRREAEDWRAAWEAERHANVGRADQVGELLELARTTAAVISSLSPADPDRKARQ